jgi:UDP-glucuronate decarboxylase
MRILVTGGAGFIGSHLIDRLMEQGHEVICLDNFYTGHKRNLLKWLNHPYFELVRHDITEPIRMEVDQIYHLACPASPVHYQYNPVKTIKTNVMGTLNMLGLAKRVKARFLLASTSEVYGDPEVHPQTEDYRGNVNPIGIRSCYDEGKRVAETLAFDYHRQNDVDIRVARIFNTYGPRMLENDGRVVSNFVVQALRGQSLTVYGEGQQTRSFCFVSDLVDGLMRLMNGDQVGPVNLGNPDEYTILQLAKAVQEMVNPELAIDFRPLPQDDPRRRKPDITKAKTWLNWQPSVPLREGLQMTIEDFRARMTDVAPESMADPVA